MIVFADGRTIWGRGFGAEGSAVGELCFNTAMTGYQEVMTDPSYARQVVAFTFPHIGNVGANDEDVEAGEAHALGCYRARGGDRAEQFPRDAGFPELDEGDGADRRVGGGYKGVDATGAARRAADGGVCASAAGEFDLAELRESAADWPGLEGMDLAKEVSRGQLEAWCGGKWSLGDGYDLGKRRRTTTDRTSSRSIMARSATSSAIWSRPGRG